MPNDQQTTGETGGCSFDSLVGALTKIRKKAMEHPAFDEEAYKERNVDALADKGGDICDWTMIAIIADDALWHNIAGERQPPPPETVGVGSNPLLVPIYYQPEIWQVEKDVIYAAIPAVEAGLEYAKELLAAHDRDLGRTTLKNKTWAETIEADIRHMTRTLEMLRACGTNVKGE